MGEKMDYKKDLVINQYSLDDEWLTQPSKVAEINVAWADAVLKRNRAKEYLEVVYAEMDLKIRKDCPEELVNPKEASYKNYIIAHPDYRKATDNFLIAEHAVNILAAGTKAFSSRGDALKNITQLYLSNYFSNPSSPPEKELQTKGAEKGTDMVSNRLDERLKKSARKPIPKG
jgi:hypothetical protein